MGRTKKAKRQKLSNQESNDGEDSIITNVEEDFIALDADDKRSRQEKRREIRIGNKRKRKEESSDSEPTLSEESLIVYPWMERMNSIQLPATMSASAFFQNEVSCFVQYMEPSKAEIRMREYLIHKVRQVIKSYAPQAQIEVFGSFKTGLYLPNSDIDIVVNAPVGVRLQLRKIASALERYDVCDFATVIERASVPVIKFEDSLTQLKVDIILDSKTGLASAEIIKTMMRHQPGLRELTLIIKHFLAIRKLNEVFTGGLGGYAIVCLVMSFLQMHPKVASGEIDPEKHLGALLVEFLHLYGINFELGRVGICVKNGGSYFDVDRFVSRNGRPVFSIRDPQDYDNDIGCKSYSASTVCRSFRRAYLTLTSKSSALAEELEYRSRKGRDVRNYLKKTSLLKSILHVPLDIINQRDLIEDVYEERRWHDEPVSETFAWTAEEKERRI
ncbi:hypothetical protein DFQ28_003175 [Apophysomyces sp. BC1034]|nr:hypothetical protein DFQ30_003907 [Apophysomyces sp. BC1015]KAG0179210.1 hypothetical protein DFQ29_002403 [Apophysomyces sp. BC1021]KAG0189604.1 hypothetical protein DFQ28_003175 [Apophysomyces sp. BC1034]